jgi:uncharacterized NAD-dependent epimerase/dehydratase family protein
VLSPQPLIIWADGGALRSVAGKTATGVIRYGRWPVTAVIDAAFAGQTVEHVTGLPSNAPVVASLDHALAVGPAKALLIGIAPPGGGLPPDLATVIENALHAGLHIISGLHVFLNDHPQWVALAQQQGVTLWDVRRPPQAPCITRQQPPAGKVLTLVGSDCSVGKMVTALELTLGLQQAGVHAAFVATGQTGLIIDPNGIPLDSITGDFMAGYVEAAVLNTRADCIVVEGQGSLLHPAYSGVTLALLHGSCPDQLILVHRAGQATIRNFTVPIPPLPDLVALYETAANWVRRPAQPPARVVGIALNTAHLSEEDAQHAVEDARQQTGLPVTDPVRFGIACLVQALQ